MVAALLLLAAAAAAQPAPPPVAAPPARAPTPASAASYFSNDDYPAEAIRNREQGLVRFRVTIGPDGSVTGCAVTASSGSASLDAATCRIAAERLRFTPARDAEGTATSDTAEFRVLWRLPG
jgi:protein TonB